MVHILLIDDHPLVTDGVKTMLATQEGIVVSAAAKTAKEALSILEQSTFEIILLDLSLPDMDGLALCSEIRKTNQSSKIIALTSTNETGIITQFLQRGGNGYLLKNMERQELIEAIEQVQLGKIYLCKGANEKILEQYRNVEVATQQAPVLTRREKEILQLLNEGLTGPQIAKQLFLSPLTVETHRKNLMQKFNANNAQMLLKLARQQRLIE
jgi:DNA-binding NarL/FixJ family response regulator